MLISFFRVVHFAVQDIIRNLSLSFMTVLILVLMLLSVNTLFGIQVLTDESLSMVRDQIDVSVYFQEGADEERIEEVQTYVASFPEVTEIEYLTPEMVEEQFREKHAANNEHIMEALDVLGENPFGALMIVKTREPADYQKVIEALNIPEYEYLIEAKSFDETEQIIERVTIVMDQVEQFSIVLTASFAMIAFLIISNTIRVAIYTQRMEISIKKLVGATNWFVRGPYLIEAFIFSVVSVLVATAMVYGAATLLDPYVAVIFHKQAFLTTTMYSNIILLLGIQFGAVLLLTILSSGLAIRRHLRV